MKWGKIAKSFFFRDPRFCLLSSSYSVNQSGLRNSWGNTLKSTLNCALEGLLSSAHRLKDEWMECHINSLLSMRRTVLDAIKRCAGRGRSSTILCSIYVYFWSGLSSRKFPRKPIPAVNPYTSTNTISLRVRVQNTQKFLFSKRPVVLSALYMDF